MAPEDKQKEYSKRYYEKNKKTILEKAKNSPAAKASRDRYRAKPETKEKRRNNRLLSLYGLTTKEYEDMLVSQAYCCAACNTHQLELSVPLNVDHNHETGQVRGLLCGNCNRALGLIKDSAETLSNLIKYLQKYGQ